MPVFFAVADLSSVLIRLCEIALSALWRFYIVHTSSFVEEKWPRWRPDSEDGAPCLAMMVHG